MDSRRTEDSIDRECRRLLLARRLISHRVRTRHITTFTGLSRGQIAHIRCRLAGHAEERHRGPSPRSLDLFLSSEDSRLYAGSLVALCRLVDVGIPTPSAPNPPSIDPLDLGERLCEVYETFQEMAPDFTLQFEDLVLLRRSLLQRELVEFGSCGQCRQLMVLDRFDRGRRPCWLCEHDARRPASRTAPVPVPVLATPIAQ